MENEFILTAEAQRRREQIRSYDFVCASEVQLPGRGFHPRLASATTTQSNTQSPGAMPISSIFGEKMRMNPLPFTKAAKLETQNGIKNRRKVCQNSSFTCFVPAVT